MDKFNTISTRQKLGALLKRFLRLMDDLKHTIFELGWLYNEGSKIFKESRKALQIIFYFEALGLLMRISQEHIVYVGFRGMIRKLMEFQNRRANQVQQLNEEVILYNKLTSVRHQVLAGQLLVNIFFGLIYQQESTAKSTIEETVEAYVHQQKDFNPKNFVPEVLSILTIIGLIEKNEATEVVFYVGPDLCCYDDSNKKIAWKIYEVVQREEQIIGKEMQENGHAGQNNLLEIGETNYEKNKQVLGRSVETQFQIDASNAPQPVHISYFPELSYALLRSATMEKTINSTVFFIGRSERRQYDYSQTVKSKSYKVDLQLPYRSVSRQHAMIVYNFQAQRWQIRCLSRKNLIRVDKERFTWGERNIWLKNKSEIQIGPEKMVFLEIAQPTD